MRKCNKLLTDYYFVLLKNYLTLIKPNSKIFLVIKDLLYWTTKKKRSESLIFGQGAQKTFQLSSRTPHAFKIS